MPPALFSTAQLGRMQHLTVLWSEPAAPEPALPGGPAAAHLYVSLLLFLNIEAAYIFPQ